MAVGKYADLEGKRVLVTGGSAGIGAATARAFAQNGARVAVLGRRIDRLEAVVRELPGSGHVAVVADLDDTAQAERATREAITKLGGLDIVVNNGGAMSPAMAGSSLADALLAGVRLHTASAAAIVGAAEEELIRNKVESSTMGAHVKQGAVVNVSSVASFIPMPRMEPYVLAKASQDALTRCQAYKYSAQGVRVNAVLPGAINTEGLESLAKANGLGMEEQLAKLAKFHPVGRVASAEEVAAPILFLSSQAASFITGQLLAVDGGVSFTSWFNSPTVDVKPPSAEHLALGK